MDKLLPMVTLRTLFGSVFNMLRGPSSLSFSAAILAEQIRLLFEKTDRILLIECLAVVLLCFVLWEVVPHERLLAWGLFICVFSCLFRSSIIHLYYRKRSSVWLYWFALGTFFSGVGWGIAGSWLMPTESIFHQTILIFVMLGVTTAANALYFPVLWIAILFLLSAMLPFLLWLIWRGDILFLLGLSGILYLMALSLSAFFSNRMLMNTLLLQYAKMLPLDGLSIEEKIAERTEALTYQAHHDALTGLPNRVLLQDRLRQAIHYAKRNGCLLTVFFLDLDDFKIINDTMGHQVGDKLLKEIAARLQKSIRDTDTVARLGGDEFILLFLEGTDKDMIQLAEQLMERITLPLIMPDKHIHVSGSIGMARYPQDGVEAEALIRAADKAMYRAKKMGKNRFQFYDIIADKK